MRLKEPLQGIKLISQGHPLVHLTFFVTQFYILQHDPKNEEYIELIKSIFKGNGDEPINPTEDDMTW